MSDSTHLLRVRWLFSMAGPPLEDAVIEIADGRVVRIDKEPGIDVTDLGNSALIPGLVNAHTHLEFSDLERPLTPAVPFADWIRNVVTSRRARTTEPGTAIGQGLAESMSGGTTLLGEIATSNESTRILDVALLQSITFREILGLDDDAISRQQAVAEAHCELSSATTSPHSVRGLSPHAPYSVHPELFRWTVDFAQRHEKVVAMHLAETREELELLDRGTGPLVDLLREWNLWRDGIFRRGTSILSYLEELARLSRVLIVHGNYLSDADIDFLAERPQFSVIYCPRTHDFFGHTEHPWRRLLDRGVNVAVGTDSRASNPDLSIWKELLHLRRQAPDMPAQTLLEMATRNGAAALGATDAGGTIEVGGPANLAVVTWHDESPASASPYDRLLHPQSRIVGTMSHGQWLTSPVPARSDHSPASETLR